MRPCGSGCSVRSSWSIPAATSSPSEARTSDGSLRCCSPGSARRSSVDTLADARVGRRPPRERGADAPHLRLASAGRPRRRRSCTRGAGYALAAAPEDVDAATLRGAAPRRGASRARREAVALLDAALGLWRGPAFAEHADVACIAPEARRLEELRRERLRSAGRCAAAGGPRRRSGRRGRGPRHRRAALGGRLGAPDRGSRGAGPHRRRAARVPTRRRRARRSRPRAVDALRESERMVLAGEPARRRARRDRGAPRPAAPRRAAGADVVVRRSRRRASHTSSSCSTRRGS